MEHLRIYISPVARFEGADETVTFRVFLEAHWGTYGYIYIYIYLVARFEGADETVMFRSL